MHNFKYQPEFTDQIYRSKSINLISNVLDILVAKFPGKMKLVNGGNF